MTKLFITGTDTGVGKTLASCALLRALKAFQPNRGISAIKPVASDAGETSEGLRNLDALLLQACQTDHPSNATPLTYQQINPICYAPPIAPHIAAMKAGDTLDMAVVDGACQPAFEHYLQQQQQQLKQSEGQPPLQLIEGAGGFLVPLNMQQSYADWVTKHQMSVVLVVQIKLGCINHSLLSYEAIKARNLPFAGWIANAVDTDRPAVVENIRTIADKLGEPLAQIPVMSQMSELNYQLDAIQDAHQIATQQPQKITQVFDQMVHYFEQGLLADLQ